ncbi:MAG: hypothetical protein WCJ87_11745, partial [Burkholderiales bacterium]
MSNTFRLAAAALVVGLSAPVPQAQALLLDRGAGMLYDTALNVTWLQDANHAKTSGYHATGQMTWTQANTWASNLDYGGYNGGWRLARNSPVNGTTSGWNYTPSNNGSTDTGFNITSTFSELSYMYYVNLGLKGYLSAGGDFQPDNGIFADGTEGGQNNVGPVNNLQSGVYWSATASAANPAVDAWYFDTVLGAQGLNLQNNEFFAWAVRDGDVTVAAVPVP